MSPRTRDHSPRRGIALIISSPSGAGKTTLARQLVQRDENVILSVSMTTRAPRKLEQDGIDYFFVDEVKFEDMQQSSELLESAQVFGYQYGTPRRFVERTLKAGRDLVFDIDWQGADQLRGILHENLVSVFILPPSLKTLRQRLRRRAQDSRRVIEARMEEVLQEMGHWQEYDYVVMNDDLETAYRELAGILEHARNPHDQDRRKP